MAARRPPAVAELRQRTERLQTFPDLESVETELLKLITYSEGPIIACLPACLLAPDAGSPNTPNF
jgi:uncharacterized protein YceH (UPF0502 family)